MSRVDGAQQSDDDRARQPGHRWDVAIRHDWTLDEVLARFEQPMNDLLFAAHSVHRRHQRANAVQISTLLSIKTGGCPEDCKYCPQSIHHDTGLDAHNLLPVATVVAAAEKARAAGATRFCMGAAWRNPTASQTRKVCEQVAAVRGMGMETCATLGMLTAEQARHLAAVGLDFYNHNLDTSPEFYGEIISTRTYADRLRTLEHVRAAGIKVCCGGIVGMGESRRDRAGLLRQLANLPEHPESVPINNLVRVPGTPLAEQRPLRSLPPLELVRCVAVARILMPRSVVRLSAGRTDLSVEAQALCFFAGAGSIFCGDQLLTTPNPAFSEDMAMLTIWASRRSRPRPARHEPPNLRLMAYNRTPRATMATPRCALRATLPSTASVSTVAWSKQPHERVGVALRLAAQQEPHPKFATHNVRQADPIGLVDGVHRSTMAPLEVAVRGRVEAKPAHRHIGHRHRCGGRP